MSNSTLSGLAARFGAARGGRIVLFYLLGAWGVIQVADTVFPALHFPAWAVTAVVITAIVGFPIAVLAGWFVGVQRGPTAGKVRGGWSASMIAVTAAVVVLAGAGLGLKYAGSRQPLPEGFVARRVLVLPLEDRTGDSAFVQIGNMAADWIARGAAEITGLEVIDPATAIAAAGDTSVRADTMRRSTLARRTQSAIVVSGSVYLQQDSLVFQGEISDGASGKMLRPLQPIKTASSNPTAAFEDLRERVMGALATLLDADLPPTSSLTSHVPKYTAYQEYSAGLETVSNESVGAARQQFEKAFALDSTFVLAQLWVVRAYMNNLWAWDKADSVAQLVAKRRHELGEMDRYVLDYLQATLRRDQAARLNAARAVSRLAPASTWQVRVATVALDSNRASDALAELDRIDPAVQKPEAAALYWSARGRTLHRLGRFEEELACMRRIAPLVPEDAWSYGAPLRALAALGRVDEIIAMLEARAASPGFIGFGLNAQIHAYELAAHGHPGKARKLTEWILADWERQSDKIRLGDLGTELHAELLAELGRREESTAVYREWAARPSQAGSEWTRTVLGRIAAESGDTAAAEETIRWLATVAQGKPGRAYVAQADIAAALGQRERAVNFLRLGFADGVPINDNTHALPNLAPLKGYPPFEELMRPK
ncbi:MAG TPA: hypothetical protein VGD27_15795 [Longimicrobiales bacterium]